jgi:hypothetical protein
LLVEICSKLDPSGEFSNMKYFLRRNFVAMVLILSSFAQIHAAEDFASQIDELKINLKNFEQASKSSNLIYRDQIKNIRIQFNDIKEANEILSIKYEKINNLWKSQIDRSQTFLSEFSDKKSKLIMLESEIDEDKIPSILMAKFKEYEKDKDKLLRNHSQEMENLDEEYYLVIDSISELRGKLIGKLFNDGYKEIYDIKLFIIDTIYEIKSIPIRFASNLFSRSHEIKLKLSSGWGGIIDLIFDLIIFIFSLSFPIFAIIFFRRFSILLTEFRSSLWRRKENKFYSISSLILQVLTPYFGWITSVVVLSFTAKMWNNLIFEDFKSFLPLVYYYFYYRIFLQMFEDLFHALKNSIKGKVVDFSQAISRSSKRIGLFYLFSQSTLYIVEFCSGPSLVFRSLSIIFSLIGIAIIIYASLEWAEFVQLFLTKYNFKFIPKLKSLLRSRYKFALVLPLFSACLFLFILQLIFRFLEKFDVGRRLLVKIYRRKIELSKIDDNDSSKKGIAIPEEYQQFFNREFAPTKSQLVGVYEEEFAKFKLELDGWVSKNHEDNLIAIYGEKGIGKTKFLENIEKNCSDFSIIRITIPPRIILKKQLIDLLADSFKVDALDGLIKTIASFDESLKQNTILLIDNAHNLFISDFRGVDTYKSFLRAINANTNNLFWVVSFNEYAYDFLRGVTGYSQYFSDEINLKKWSFQSIQELILSRHPSENFDLSYEEMSQYSLSSAKSENASDKIENQVFSILWEQSGGNPEVAMKLWLTSLTPNSSKIFEVGLPKKPSTSKIKLLDTNAWFVLAALAKHSNLSKKEAARACNLSYPVVSHSIKILLGIGIIFIASPNRYEIDILFQEEIVRQLRMKNFIYGN